MSALKAIFAMMRTECFSWPLMLVALLFFSCNKNQRVVADLSDGEWEVIYAVDKTGAPLFEDVDDWSGSLIFESCKLRKEKCSGQLELRSKVVTEIGKERLEQEVKEVWEFKYVVTTKGTELQLDIADKITETRLVRRIDGAIISESSNSNTEACAESRGKTCSTDGSFDPETGEVSLFNSRGDEVVAVLK